VVSQLDSPTPASPRTKIVRSGSSPFLFVEEVAARLRCSRRTVHELTRLREIPHRRLSGSRRCLFRVEELEAWENGADLELVELAGGGRVVRPAQTDTPH
jgi:excisionase family DNA binding protein